MANISKGPEKVQQKPEEVQQTPEEEKYAEEVQQESEEVQQNEREGEKNRIEEKNAIRERYFTITDPSAYHRYVTIKDAPGWLAYRNADLRGNKKREKLIHHVKNDIVRMTIPITITINDEIKLQTDTMNNIAASLLKILDNADLSDNAKDAIYQCIRQVTWSGELSDTIYDVIPVDSTREVYTNTLTITNTAISFIYSYSAKHMPTSVSLANMNETTLANAMHHATHYLLRTSVTLNRQSLKGVVEYNMYQLPEYTSIWNSIAEQKQTSSLALLDTLLTDLRTRIQDVLSHNSTNSSLSSNIKTSMTRNIERIMQGIIRTFTESIRRYPEYRELGKTYSNLYQSRKNASNYLEALTSFQHDVQERRKEEKKNTPVVSSGNDDIQTLIGTLLETLEKQYKKKAEHAIATRKSATANYQQIDIKNRLSAIMENCSHYKDSANTGCFSSLSRTLFGRTITNTSKYISREYNEHADLHAQVADLEVAQFNATLECESALITYNQIVKELKNFGKSSYQVMTYDEPPVYLPMNNVTQLEQAVQDNDLPKATKLAEELEQTTLADQFKMQEKNTLLQQLAVAAVAVYTHSDTSPATLSSSIPSPLPIPTSPPPIPTSPSIPSISTSLPPIPPPLMKTIAAAAVSVAELEAPVASAAEPEAPAASVAEPDAPSTTRMKLEHATKKYKELQAELNTLRRTGVSTRNSNTIMAINKKEQNLSDAFNEKTRLEKEYGSRLPDTPSIPLMPYYPHPSIPVETTSSPAKELVKSAVASETEESEASIASEAPPAAKARAPLLTTTSFETRLQELSKTMPSYIEKLEGPVQQGGASEEEKEMLHNFYFLYTTKMKTVLEDSFLYKLRKIKIDTLTKLVKGNTQLTFSSSTRKPEAILNALGSLFYVTSNENSFDILTNQELASALRTSLYEDIFNKPNYEAIQSLYNRNKVHYKQLVGTSTDTLYLGMTELVGLVDKVFHMNPTILEGVNELVYIHPILVSYLYAHIDAYDAAKSIIESLRSNPVFVTALDKAYQDTNQMELFIKFRNDDAGQNECNKRFNVLLNKNEPIQQFLMQYNDANIPYYQRISKKKGGPAIFQEMKTNPDYPYSYAFGRFTNVFLPDKTNEQIATEMTSIKDKLKNGTNVFMIGYGASGSGKTSSLISLKRGETRENGIITHLCNQLSDQFSKVTLTCVEIYETSDSKNTLILTSPPISFIVENSSFVLASNYVHKNNHPYRCKDEETTTFTQGTSMGEVVIHVIDTDRFIRATTNNPQSSRSHALVFVKFENRIAKELTSSSDPTLIIGDFAGVENAFACDKPETLNAFLSVQGPNGTPYYSTLSKGKTTGIMNHERVEGGVVKTMTTKEMKKKKAENMKLIENTITKHSPNEKVMPIAIPVLIPKEKTQQEYLSETELPFSWNQPIIRTSWKLSDELKTYYETGTFKTAIDILLGYGKVLVGEETHDEFVKSWNSITSDACKKELSLYSLQYKHNNPIESFSKELLDARTKLIRKMIPSVGNTLVRSMSIDLKSKKTDAQRKLLESTMGKYNTYMDEMNILISDILTKYKQPPITFTLDINLFVVPGAFQGTSNEKLAAITDKFNSIYGSTLDNLTKSFTTAYQSVSSTLNTVFKGKTFTLDEFTALQNAIFQPHGPYSNLIELVKDMELETYYRTQYAKEICTHRLAEGNFINQSLSDVRTVIQQLIYNSNKDNADNIPFFMDKCLPDYCDDFESCFPSSSSNAISSAVFDAIKSNIKEHFNQLTISVFCVVNLSKAANNPPPVPYLDINVLKRLMISKTDTSTVNEKLTAEIGRIKGRIDGDMKDKLGWMKIEMEKVDLMKPDDVDAVDTIIAMIDKSNAASTIGTLEYMQSLALNLTVSTICTVKGESDAYIKGATSLYDNKQVSTGGTYALSRKKRRERRQYTRKA